MHSRRIYVAGRFREYERVRAVIDRLKGFGHQVTYDWTRTAEFGVDGHPVSEDLSGATLPRAIQARFAQNDLDGVAQADLLVVLADSDLCGALIEVGAALAHRKPVWVVNPQRWTIFYASNLVRVFDDVEEVFARLHPEVERV